MAFKMYGKSPMMKALIGKQKNLPEELKAKILAAPDDSPKKMYGKSPKKKYKSDAQRKAVHASKAESGMKNYMNPEEYKVFNMGNTPKKMYGKKKK
jgi:hypothetical protein|tara:strand:- start:4511 stop:4798 length:288 start_codon:yes stop_codon:yes gene_type:complete